MSELSSTTSWLWHIVYTNRHSENFTATQVNQLRDPTIFEEDGELYLLYTGAGEQAIGIAKLSQQ